MFRVTSTPSTYRGDGAEVPAFSVLMIVSLALVIGIYILARLWNLTSYNLWGGEAFTMYGVRQSWVGMFDYVIQDAVHPPLFYVLLKLWTSLGGESLLWLKLFPALASITTIVPLILLLGELKLEPGQIIVIFALIAVNPYLVHYAQELRMYSLFVFWAVCSFLFFVRHLNSESNGLNLLALTITNVLLVYTHYYGWLVIGSEFLVLLIWARQKLNLFLYSSAFVSLLFLPWAYLVAEVLIRKGGLGPNLGWIPRPQLTTLAKYYAGLGGSAGFPGSIVIGLFLFCFPVLLWGWRVVFRGNPHSGSRDRTVFWLLIIVAVLPVIVIFFASQLLPQALWIDRYFIFTIAPYMTLVTLAIFRIQADGFRIAMLLVVVLWSSLTGLRQISRNELAWQGGQLGSRIEWESLVKQMVQAESGRDEILDVHVLTTTSNGIGVGYWTVATSMEFYLDGLDEERFRFVWTPNMETLFNSIEDDRFWLAFFESGFWRRHPPREALINRGYRVGEGFHVGSLDNRFVLLPVWPK